MLLHKRFTFLSLFLFSIFIFSCESTKKLENAAYKSNSKNELTVVFAGDIMAHKPNYAMKNYSIIWDDIRQITENTDFSFANIEAPVDNSIPFDTYPTFNMQESYPQAAIDAGFNVLSTANNHTNDKELSGINATKSWSKKIMEQTKNSSRPVYISGLKNDRKFSYSVIEHKNFKILYLAFTEILNTNSFAKEINFVPPDKSSRNHFIDFIANLRKENPCDLFILQIHTCEPEYVLEIARDTKEFYHTLLENGVDIISANHPHVPQPIELIGDKKTKRITKALLYASGNVISAQRWKPDFDHPEKIHEYTGDGRLNKFIIKKDKKGIFISENRTFFITTYIDDNKNYSIKLLDDDIKKKTDQKWSTYLLSRLEYLKNIKDFTTWQ